MTRLILALSCSALLWLSGCSDAASSSAEPPTPSASPSAPETSPTEEAETPEEFVRRWVEADREMQNTGDAAEYRKLTRGCVPCEGVADQVEGIYAKGGYVKTDGLVVRSVKASDADSNGEVEVRLAVRSTPTEYVEEASGPMRTLPGGPVTYLVTLQPDQRSWVMTLLERLTQ